MKKFLFYFLILALLVLPVFAENQTQTTKQDDIEQTITLINQAKYDAALKLIYSVKVPSNKEERALYYLTMYRHADPDNDWLLGTAQADPLYSFCCDIKLNSSEYIYLVYDTILHPNLYWIENGRAFRLYMYFGEEETDLSQENVIELCKVILHPAAN